MRGSCQGSCLCGAVAYEIQPYDMKIGHCSCRTCRKAHAAPFAATTRVPRDHFSFLKGEDRLTSFESSPGKLRRFCSVCGSHVLAERPADPWVILRVATLDDDPGARPLIHIWRSHEVPWCASDGAEGGDIKDFAEWPPGR